MSRVALSTAVISSRAPTDARFSALCGDSAMMERAAASDGIEAVSAAENRAAASLFLIFAAILLLLNAFVP